MNRMKGKRIMKIILLVIIILIVVVIIFFNIPYSKTKSEFNELILNMIDDKPESSEVFSQEDIEDLPIPVQKYFEYCGYLGTPKMSYMKSTFKDVNFYMSTNKTLKIDYTQYNFVDKPQRFAFIDSSLYGIPFEGFDSYKNGVGSMKGIIAKVIPLFDQKGGNMDKASLVTFLAEALTMPNVAIQDYITWESIDDIQAKATITYYGISASGVFTFDKNGAMLSFVTDDRVATDMNGKERKVKWSAITSDYQIRNGIKQPKILQSIWHYPEGDNIYFNENKSIVQIEYNK